jgi:hypothetical protein
VIVGIIGRGRWTHDGQPPIVRGQRVARHVEHLPRTDGRVNNKTLWLWWEATVSPISTVLPGLPAPLRHRAHGPVRQEYSRMNSTVAVYTRTS